MQLKAVEVKSHGDNYVIQAWNKGTSTAMDLERHCTPEDLRKLEIDGRAKRKAFSGPPNLLSLSQVLRLAGNYVDRMRGRLIRVSWQDQSDKIQSVTIQYEPWPVDRREQGEAQTTVIEEVCIHIYKQRKKIAAVAGQKFSPAVCEREQRELSSIDGSRLIFDFPPDDCYLYRQIFDPFSLDFEGIFGQHSDIG